MRKNRIIITGGGTGGHLFPAIAMAGRFEAEGWDVELIGSQSGIERKILKNYNYRYYLLNSAGFVGKSVFRKVKSLFKLFDAVFESVKILKGFEPKALLTTGGFVGLPASIAAFLLKIPIFVTEQNSIPGFANRIIGKFAKHIFLNFSSTAEFFEKSKLSIVGNPIRQNIKNAQKGIKHRELPITVVVLGGSRGAKAINDAVIEMAEFVKLDGSLNLIAQTGEAQFEEVRAAYTDAANVHVLKFIDDMAAVYSAADMAVSRAGATTISELVYLLIPAIFIPYPFAANNHQKKNALEIAKTGGAIVIDNYELSGRLLYKAIKENAVKLQNMSDNLKKIKRAEADMLIFDKIKEITN